MLKIFRCSVAMITVILLSFSSCSIPTDQPLNSDEGEITSASTIEEESTLPDTGDEPTFITSDLNDDGVEEKIAIAVSSATAAIQIKQTKDGGDSALADFTFSESEKGGYYLRLGKNNNNDEVLYWNYSIIDGSRLVFKYEVYSFDGNGEKEYRKREAATLDVGSDATISSESLVFSILQSTLNSFLVSDHSYDVYVLIENRGNGVIYSTADNMIEAEEVRFNLRDFLNKY